LETLLEKKYNDPWEKIIPSTAVVFAIYELVKAKE